MAGGQESKRFLGGYRRAWGLVQEPELEGCKKVLGGCRRVVALVLEGCKKGQEGFLGVL